MPNLRSSEIKNFYWSVAGEYKNVAAAVATTVATSYRKATTVTKTVTASIVNWVEINYEIL